MYPTRGGLDDRMPVLEVGMGVGYFRKALDVACRFEGRGRPGDEDKGSNGGSSDGAGRLMPATDGRVGSIPPRVFIADGDESMLW